MESFRERTGVKQKLPKLPDSKPKLTQTLQNVRRARTGYERVLNAQAERGEIEHPDAPKGLVNTLGDLIPDQPGEIALAVGSGAAGTVLKGAARGAAAGFGEARAVNRLNRLRAKLPESVKRGGPVPRKQAQKLQKAEDRVRAYGPGGPKAVPIGGGPRSAIGLA